MAKRKNQNVQTQQQEQYQQPDRGPISGGGGGKATLQQQQQQQQQQQDEQLAVVDQGPPKWLSNHSRRELYCQLTAQFSPLLSPTLISALLFDSFSPTSSSTSPSPSLTRSQIIDTLLTLATSLDDTFSLPDPDSLYVQEEEQRLLEELSDHGFGGGGGGGGSSQDGFTSTVDVDASDDTSGQDSDLEEEGAQALQGELEKVRLERRARGEGWNSSESEQEGPTMTSFDAFWNRARQVAPAEIGSEASSSGAFEGHLAEQDNMATQKKKKKGKKARTAGYNSSSSDDDDDMPQLIQVDENGRSTVPTYTTKPIGPPPPPKVPCQPMVRPPRTVPASRKQEQKDEEKLIDSDGDLSPLSPEANKTAITKGSFGSLAGSAAKWKAAIASPASIKALAASDHSSTSAPPAPAPPVLAPTSVPVAPPVATPPTAIATTAQVSTVIPGMQTSAQLAPSVVPSQGSSLAATPFDDKVNSAPGGWTEGHPSSDGEDAHDASFDSDGHGHGNGNGNGNGTSNGNGDEPNNNDDSSSDSNSDDAEDDERLLFLQSMFPEHERDYLKLRMDQADAPLDMETLLEELLNEEFIATATEPVEEVEEVDTGDEYPMDQAHMAEEIVEPELLTKKEKRQLKVARKSAASRSGVTLVRNAPVDTTRISSRIGARPSPPSNAWQSRQTDSVTLDSITSFLAQKTRVDQETIKMLYEENQSFAAVLTVIAYERSASYLNEVENLNSLLPGLRSVPGRAEMLIRCTFGDVGEAYDLEQHLREHEDNETAAALAKRGAAGAAVWGAASNGPVITAYDFERFTGPSSSATPMRPRQEVESWTTVSKTSVAGGKKPATPTPVFTAPDHESYEECKFMVQKYRELRTDSLNESRRAFSSTRGVKGYGGAASMVKTSDARRYDALLREWEGKAAWALEIKQSTSFACAPLDLHHHTVSSALSLVKVACNRWWQNPHSVGQSALPIIVGQGLHSVGGKSVIGPAVTKFLDSHGWKWRWDGKNPGALFVEGVVREGRGVNGGLGRREREGILKYR